VSPARAIRTAPPLPDAEPLPAFLARVPPLSPGDRYGLVTQARTLLEGVYVHLALKRSMHAVEPVQRLRLLERRLDGISDLGFHQELSGIFRSLGDLHTLYELPVPYRGNVATLGILVERCVGEDGAPRFVVTRVEPALMRHGLEPGAEVLTWNGVPVERAVELGALHGGGSNPAARTARGVEALSLRPLSASPPPDEHEVLVAYRSPRGRRAELLLPWWVQPAEVWANQNPVATASALHGIDPAGEATRQIKRTRFGSGRGGPARALDSVVLARTLRIGPRRIGYLRIYSFNVSSARTFAEQLAAKLARLPAEGLVVDIRGNPGGHVPAAETLVQLLSPEPVTSVPVSFSLTTTPLALALCRANPQLKGWVDSIADAVETGEDYSQGFPLSAPQELAAGLPRYAGPKVLIVDARSYSAADIFAAGWQDNGLGPILGTAERTGAGGANVWTHELLRLWLPDQLGELPMGAGFRIALRRATRVGANVGVPLEDLGVRADVVREPTFADVTGSNEDLLAAAAGLLPARAPGGVA
jgi:hypothetical protein